MIAPLTGLMSTRCFLFLVNYARMKSDVALKALPVLVAVGLMLLSQ